MCVNAYIYIDSIDSMLRAMLGKALALQARSARLFTPCVADHLAPAEGGFDVWGR